MGIVFINKRKEYESKIGEYRVAKAISIHDICEMAGITQTAFSGLQSGMVSPIFTRGKNKGQLKPEVEKICDILDIEVEDAFPRYFCKITHPGGGLTQDQLELVFMPIRKTALSAIIYKETIDSFYEFLRGVLTKRQFEVICLRFGMAGEEEHTLQSIGNKNGVGKNAIRVVESKAIRKIRKYKKYIPEISQE